MQQKSFLFCVECIFSKVAVENVTALKKRSTFQVIFKTLLVTLQEQPKQPFADVLHNRCSKNFAIFTGKRLCWSLFLIKLYLKKLCEYCKIFKNK